MKKLILVSLIIVQSCIAFAQNYCVNDTIIREIQFPMTERDAEPVFYYFNNEWIPLAYENKVHPDSIQSAEIKNDEYGNRAVFFTVSPGYLEYIKAENRKYFINLDARCEFPGGNGKLKEWIDENIRIPEGFKGSERVFVKFTVHPDGSISDPKIIRRPSKNEAVNQEALRLVNALPKFRVKYYIPHLKKNFHLILPITFKEPGAIFIRGDESSTINQSLIPSSTTSPKVGRDSTHKQAPAAYGNGEKPFTLVDPYQNPYYLNGGGEGLLSDLYIALSKTAPVTRDSVKGRAAVTFIISKEGVIDPNSIKIMRNRSVPDDYMAAAIEAIKNLGKFEPGKFDGKPRNVSSMLPVIYPIPSKYMKTTE